MSKERILELQEELKKASDDYYNGIESMSNFEYDAKFDELKKLEKEENSPNKFTDTIGAKTVVKQLNM